jgi:hypothetical protein
MPKKSDKKRKPKAPRIKLRRTSAARPKPTKPKQKLKPKPKPKSKPEPKPKIVLNHASGNSTPKMKVASGFRELSPAENVEPGDEFYFKTFAGWYAVKDSHIGHPAKGELFRRPDKKEEINQSDVAA